MRGADYEFGSEEIEGRNKDDCNKGARFVPALSSNCRANDSRAKRHVGNPSPEPQIPKQRREGLSTCFPSIERNPHGPQHPTPHETQNGTPKKNNPYKSYHGAIIDSAFHLLTAYYRAAERSAEPDCL